MSAKTAERAAYQAAWYRANRGRLLVLNRRYRAAHLEEEAARGKRWRAANPEKKQASRRRLRLASYGLTQKDYEAMTAAQDHACLICGAEAWMERTGVLHVDHCHITGEVRGLLCDRCNKALGGFRDDPHLLMKAVEYLDMSARQ